MSKLDDFFNSQKILRLATVNDAGFPHVVPVWYLYYKKKIYIGTNTRTQKISNLKKNHKVSFCVDIGIRSPIYGVMGSGTAKLIQKKELVSKLAKKILQKYFKTLENKSAKELLEDTDCIVEILPKKLAVWNY